MKKDNLKITSTVVTHQDFYGFLNQVNNYPSFQSEV